MKKIIACLLTFIIVLSFGTYCYADTLIKTLNTPIKSSLLYECFFNDEEFDEAKFEKALNEIEYIDPIKKYKVSTLTDYAHVDTEIISLGTGEGVTVTLETTPANIAFDDFMFHYDETLLDVTAKDIINDPIKDKTTLHLVIHTKQPCHTSFEIYETYPFFDEQLAPDTNISYTELKIVGKNATDGHIVYITPTGEKYHFSSDCAGENYTATTLSDALSVEYTPCQKCVH